MKGVDGNGRKALAVLTRIDVDYSKVDEQSNIVKEQVLPKYLREDIIKSSAPFDTAVPEGGAWSPLGGREWSASLTATPPDVGDQVQVLVPKKRSVVAGTLVAFGQRVRVPRITIGSLVQVVSEGHVSAGKIGRITTDEFDSKPYKITFNEKDGETADYFTREEVIEMVNERDGAQKPRVGEWMLQLKPKGPEPLHGDKSQVSLVPASLETALGKRQLLHDTKKVMAAARKTEGYTDEVGMILQDAIPELRAIFWRCVLPTPPQHLLPLPCFILHTLLHDPLQHHPAGTNPFLSANISLAAGRRYANPTTATMELLEVLAFVSNSYLPCAPADILGLRKQDTFKSSIMKTTIKGHRQDLRAACVLSLERFVCWLLAIAHRQSVERKESLASHVRKMFSVAQADGGVYPTGTAAPTTQLQPTADARRAALFACRKLERSWLRPWLGGLSSKFEPQDICVLRSTVSAIEKTLLEACAVDLRRSRMHCVPGPHAQVRCPDGTKVIVPSNDLGVKQHSNPHLSRGQTTDPHPSQMNDGSGLLRAASSSPIPAQYSSARHRSSVPRSSRSCSPRSPWWRWRPVRMVTCGRFLW